MQGAEAEPALSPRHCDRGVGVPCDVFSAVQNALSWRFCCWEEAQFNMVDSWQMGVLGFTSKLLLSGSVLGTSEWLVWARFAHLCGEQCNSWSHAVVMSVKSDSALSVFVFQVVLEGCHTCESCGLCSQGALQPAEQTLYFGFFYKWTHYWGIKTYCEALKDGLIIMGRTGEGCSGEMSGCCSGGILRNLSTVTRELGACTWCG